jgi:hypothetical protein
MNSQDFLDIVTRARTRQDKILSSKGLDYTRHEEDRLSNFKRSAAAIGLDPLQVWAIFVNKHLDAIMAFIKTGKAESEAIEGRFDDVINYMYLGEALLIEAQRNKPAQIQVGEPGQIVAVQPAFGLQQSTKDNLCRSQLPGGHFFCSRSRGHIGDHEAYSGHDLNQPLLGVWPKSTLAGGK